MKWLHKPAAGVALLLFWTAGLRAQDTVDPFAGVTEAAKTAPAPVSASWTKRLGTEKFGFRKELMSQFDVDPDGHAASRQSVGFEILKKFSTATSTVASFDFQARFVRRDRYNGAPNDMEGAGRQGWAFEYHNLYLDLYNVFNPLMGDKARGRNVGR